jgi:hypothetical protein
MNIPTFLNRLHREAEGRETMLLTDFFAPSNSCLMWALVLIFIQNAEMFAVAAPPRYGEHATTV